MSTTTTDTTGTIVMAGSDSGTRIAIYRDLGHYSGTIAEYNVRSLEQIQHFPGLCIVSPEVESIYHRNNGYGCGWGDIMRLMPVSADDISTLAAASAEAEATRSARQAARDAECEPQSDLLCPRCGTYCYGDCTASA